MNLSIIVLNNIPPNFIFEGWVIDNGKMYFLARVIYAASHQKQQQALLDQRGLEKDHKLLAQAQIVRVLKQNLPVNHEMIWLRGDSLPVQLIFGENKFLPALIANFSIDSKPAMQFFNFSLPGINSMLGLLGGYFGKYTAGKIIKNNFAQKRSILPQPLLLYLLFFSSVITITVLFIFMLNM